MVVGVKMLFRQVYSCITFLFVVNNLQCAVLNVPLLLSLPGRYVVCVFV